MPHAAVPVNSDKALSLFQGGGEMGALMRAYDWDAHPLGSPALWPQSLKTNIRLLLNSNFPMFIWWSKDHLYCFHNDAYLPALGKKHPSALGAPAKEVWAEIWQDLGGIVENILQGGESFYAESLKLLLERKGFSEETYWTFSYSPAFHDDGAVSGIFCACYEVTDSVLTERRLQVLKDISDAMAQIQTMEQACQAAGKVIDQDPSDIPFSQIYLLHRSETGAHLMGQSGLAQADVSTVISLSGEASAPGVWPLQEVLEKKEPLLLDLPDNFLAPGQTTSAGTPKQAVVLPIFRPGQNMLMGFYVAGISRQLEYDAAYQRFHGLLTGQIATSIASVHVQEEKARRQAELVEMFQQAPVAICILRGPAYVVELANPGICSIWGKNQQDVLGKPVLDALPEVKDQGIKAMLDGVYQTGVPYVNQELALELMRNQVPETVYVSFVYHPLRNSKGEITGIITVAIDISDQVRMRHEVEGINQELRISNADLDNFVYAASHDLKAPISNIQGLMDTLVEFLPPETLQQDVVQRVLSLIHSSMNRFKRAVADLTEVAKVQRSAQDDVSLVNLEEITAELLLDFEPFIVQTQAQVTTNFTQNSLIRFSAKNVRSIVYNLLSNALKYSSPHRAPRIAIQTRLQAPYLVFSLSDNGLGIATEDREKIFFMFKRLHDHVEGTGIGLHIVKRIVENAGGSIEVESAVGKGTTFKIYFRLQE